MEIPATAQRRSGPLIIPLDLTIGSRLESGMTGPPSGGAHGHRGSAGSYRLFISLAVVKADERRGFIAPVWN